MNKKQKVIITLIIVLIIALLSLPFWAKYAWLGYRAPETQDEMCYPIKRKYYPLRHWLWSGIPGEQGAGFIPDPHFLWSETMPFPEPVLRIMVSKKARFQVMDVNPFFNDESSEILLLIKSDNKTYEYQLQFPRFRNAQAVIATPDLPAIRAFPSGQGVALAANFMSVKGIYVLSLPLKAGAILQLIPANKPEFETIASRLKLHAQDKTIKSQFCDTRRNDFVALYENYSGALCEKRKVNRESIAAKYAEFWLK